MIPQTLPNQPASYFKSTGRWLSIVGVAMAVLTLALGLVAGRGWMMGVMAPLPLIGFGVAMMLVPGEAAGEPPNDWETAWQQTPARIRAVWLCGLLVGCAGGMLAWMLLLPYISF